MTSHDVRPSQALSDVQLPTVLIRCQEVVNVVECCQRVMGESVSLCLVAIRGS